MLARSSAEEQAAVVATMPPFLSLGASNDALLAPGSDLPRHGWQREVWAAVRAAGAPAVLVDLGLPRPAELDGGPYVLVGGAARPNLAVAAEILANGTAQD